MLAIMGHMSRAMLERYSHVRMKAKRTAVESLAFPKSEPVLQESTKVETEPVSLSRLQFTDLTSEPGGTRTHQAY